MARSFAFTAAGLAAGFSGVAMLLFIVGSVPLPLAEGATVAVAAVALWLYLRRLPPGVVAAVLRLARAGVVVGAMATVAYDVARIALSFFAALPYDPFAAIRQFGYGILPPDSSPATVLGVGFVVHLINGSSFGVIYAMFAHRHITSFRAAVGWGMAWGLVLEFVQSILYPGWLGITATLGEFFVITGASHLVYGATLGVGLRRRLGADVPSAEGAPS